MSVLYLTLVSKRKKKATTTLCSEYISLVRNKGHPKLTIKFLPTLDSCWQWWADLIFTTKEEPTSGWPLFSYANPHCPDGYPKWWWSNEVFLRFRDSILKQLRKSLRIQKLVLTKSCEACVGSIGKVGVNPKDAISAHLRKPAAGVRFLQWFSSSSFFLFFQVFRGVQCPILAFKKVLRHSRLFSQMGFVCRYSKNSLFIVIGFSRHPPPSP